MAHVTVNGIELRSITVISSDLDYLAPHDKQPYIDAMPTAEMIVIEDAHHAVPMERPDRFNAAPRGGPELARVAHTGGDPVDGQQHGPVQLG